MVVTVRCLGKSLGEVAGVRGTGLYLTFSSMNHSCLANTLTTLSSTGDIEVTPDNTCMNYTGNRDAKPRLHVIVWFRCGPSG